MKETDILNKRNFTIVNLLPVWNEGPKKVLLMAHYKYCTMTNEPYIAIRTKNVILSMCGCCYTPAKVEPL